MQSLNVCQSDTKIQGLGINNMKNKVPFNKIRWKGPVFHGSIVLRNNTS